MSFEPEQSGLAHILGKPPLKGLSGNSRVFARAAFDDGSPLIVQAIVAVIAVAVIAIAVSLLLAL